MTEYKKALLTSTIALLIIITAYTVLYFFYSDKASTERDYKKQWVHKERLEAVNLGSGVYGNITVSLVFDNPELHKKAFLNKSKIKEALVIAVTNAVNIYGREITKKEIVDSIKASPYILNDLNSPEVYIEEFVTSKK